MVGSDHENILSKLDNKRGIHFNQTRKENEYSKSEETFGTVIIDTKDQESFRKNDKVGQSNFSVLDEDEVKKKCIKITE